MFNPSAKPKRLAPQPTDTALARLVQRMVDRFPFVTRSTYLDLTHVHHRLRQKYEALHRAFEDMHAHHAELLKDLKAMMQRIPKAKMRFWTESRVSDAEMAKIETIKVEFEPVYVHLAFSRYEALRRRDLQPHELADYTQFKIREAAGELARLHAREVEREIFNITMRKIGEGKAHV